MTKFIKEQKGWLILFAIAMVLMIWRDGFTVLINDWRFATELAVDGLLTGLMYSLIAVGFVLIYKSTD